MSIIPVSALASSDLAILSNNIGGSARHRRRRTKPVSRRRIAAINRSLAPHGEQIPRLHRPPLSAHAVSWT